MGTTYQNMFGGPNWSDEDSQRRKGAFMKRIWEREFDDLSKLDDYQLEEAVTAAKDALRGFPPLISERETETLDDFNAVASVYESAVEEQRGRNYTRYFDVDSQASRQGSMLAFAESANKLCESFARTPLDAAIMAPEPKPALDSDKAAEYDDQTLLELARQQRWLISESMRDVERIDAAITNIRRLIDTEAIGEALGSLQARRDYLSQSLTALRSTEETALAELGRRQREYVERKQAEKDLPETVRQLQQRIAELEEEKAATA